MALRPRRRRLFPPPLPKPSQKSVSSAPKVSKEMRQLAQLIACTGQFSSFATSCPFAPADVLTDIEEDKGRDYEALYEAFFARPRQPEMIRAMMRKLLTMRAVTKECGYRLIALSRNEYIKAKA